MNTEEKKLFENEKKILFAAAELIKRVYDRLEADTLNPEERKALTAARNIIINTNKHIDKVIRDEKAAEKINAEVEELIRKGEYYN